MEKELTDQIERVKPLASLAKERGKNYPANDGYTGIL